MNLALILVKDSVRGLQLLCSLHCCVCQMYLYIWSYLNSLVMVAFCFGL